MGSLDDDMVKLVSYTIVSVRRGAERVMPGGERTVVVTDRLSGEAFIAWIIAKYVQEQQGTDNAVPTEDEEYLRLYYVVSNRWPREPLKFPEKQIRLLQEIRNGLAQNE